MTGHELRQRFLEFFQAREHAIIASSALVPQNDPTLLFTNAGMVQFKDVFLGADKRTYKRATTAQKCVRAGGKHNDLENVGRTARHHTFFEMMGNFSFGDYFKKDAITFAWEFLTGTLRLPVDKLWATVYRDDDEAFELWHHIIGIPRERIVRLGEKDNFWAMGDTGPCGPCSEIVIDQGEAMRCGPNCGIGQCDCDRYLELWNLVFMQFERDAAGKLTPLPKPSIDTGMGLERVAAVLQGVHSNFDTDLFAPMIRFVEACTGKTYKAHEQDDISMRVIADHLRSTTFLISDGVLPSNEGRGYVLRRIMRRAARHGKMLGLAEPFLYKGIEAVVGAMQGVYQELADNCAHVTQVTLHEERRFAHTLNQGMERLNTLIAETHGQQRPVLDGKKIFELYDTFGFPLDLTQDIATDNHLTIDVAGFEREMEMQRTRARQAWKGSGDVAVDVLYKELAQKFPATRFTGYETMAEPAATVLALIKDGNVIENAAAGDKVGIILDVTPCYGESGGQVGDTGSLKALAGNGDAADLPVPLLNQEGAGVVGAEVVIANVTKPVPELVLHHGTIVRGELHCGQKVAVAVDAERRQHIRLNHTATHLLHAALREVLGDHVKQAGSHVAPERLRFDFTHFSALEEQDAQRIEEIVNADIRANAPVKTTEAALDDALNMGAMAFFEEKYGERVRVVQVSGISMELCGGTHVGATGEIGLCKVLSESSIAAGMRRIEAVTGKAALRTVHEREQQLRQAALLLKATPGELPQRVEKLIVTAKEHEKEVERLKLRLAGFQIDGLLAQAREIDGVKVIAAQVDNLDVKALRNFADVLKDKLHSGVVVLGTVEDGRVALIATVTKDLIPQYHAGNLIKAVAAVVEGSGGGRPDMAQAGGKNARKLPEALQRVFQLIQGGSAA